MRRVSRVSMPYIAASVGSAPGPTPNMARPESRRYLAFVLGGFVLLFTILWVVEKLMELG